MQNSYKSITRTLMAAKLLWLCRMNKIPIMLHEVSTDFRVPTKNIVNMLSKTNYIPPLSVADYIGRISRQFGFPDNVRDIAIDISSENTEGSSPTVRACCAVMKAVNKYHLKIKTSDIASSLDFTPAGIRLANKRRLSDLVK